MTSPLSPDAPPTAGQQAAGRLAAGIVALHTLVVAGFAVAYLIEVLTGGSRDTVVTLMMVLLLVVFAVGLGYVSAGLWRRHERAQAPAVAWCLLLIPAGIVFLTNGVWVGALVVLSSLAGVFATLAMGRLGSVP